MDAPRPIHHPGMWELPCCDPAAFSPHLTLVSLTNSRLENEAAAVGGGQWDPGKGLTSLSEE